MKKLTDLNVEILTETEKTSISGGSELSDAFFFLLGGVGGWIVNAGRHISQHNGEGCYKY